MQGNRHRQNADEVTSIASLAFQQHFPRSRRTQERCSHSLGDLVRDWTECISCPLDVTIGHCQRAVPREVPNRKCPKPHDSRTARLAQSMIATRYTKPSAIGI